MFSAQMRPNGILRRFRGKLAVQNRVWREIQTDFSDITQNENLSSMSGAIDNLEEAQRRAMAIRPRVGGFPFLAETLRRAGVTRNSWFLPACQSLFLTNNGPVVIQGTPLAIGAMDVPPLTARR